MTTPVFYLLLAALCSVAFLYASIGHGGASGYLAVLALFGVGTTHIKVSVLLLNLLVSCCSFWQYYRGGHFRWRLFWPFALASVPAAFLGALLPVDAGLYRKLLGACLLFSVFRILQWPRPPATALRNPRPGYMLGTGAGIGFFSGILGIGGGVLLSPVMLLCRWADLKQAAAVSSAFIFVNSLAGLIGTGMQGFGVHSSIAGWLAAAFGGGLAGAYLGSRRFPLRALRVILALVLATAAVKLLAP